MIGTTVEFPGRTFGHVRGRARHEYVIGIVLETYTAKGGPAARIGCLDLSGRRYETRKLLSDCKKPRGLHVAAQVERLREAYS